MMVARPLLLLAAYLILVCDICGETLLPLDAEGSVGSNALGLRRPRTHSGRAGAAHSFTRYPDTATAFASKWNVAPGCNIILNGVPKEKVSDTVASVLVATKWWKAAPLSPS